MSTLSGIFSIYRRVRFCIQSFMHVRLELGANKMAQELDKSNRKIDVLQVRAEQAEELVQVLKKETDRLASDIHKKEQELLVVRRDLDTIGEKLVDELERRAELQHSKDAVQEELEELTRSLFEEANSMVATEARERHRFEEQELTLKKQLDQLRLQLQMEQGQLRELRLRMEQMTLENQKLKRANLQTKNAAPTRSLSDPNSTGNMVDPQLLVHFEELIDLGPKTKLAKIHTIPYLKFSLEDDVLPCLRFGPNPKLSGRKFIDAIVSNSCFVEEMTAAQISTLEARDESVPLAALSRSNLSKESPDPAEESTLDGKL